MGYEYDELENMNLSSREEEELEDDEEDDDEDEGISFEKYAELSAKLDPLEPDRAAQEKLLEK
jgi:hypothetical protein